MKVNVIYVMKSLMKTKRPQENMQIIVILLESMVELDVNIVT